MTTDLRDSFTDREKRAGEWFKEFLPLLQAKLAPRDYIYCIILLDSLKGCAEAAETERDAIKKLFNAVKELIK